MGEDAAPAAPTGPPPPPALPGAALRRLLGEGVVWGDSSEWLRRLPEESVDLFFTSPPYADARSYMRIRPEDYVGWFTPFASGMLAAVKETGSFVLNIKNRVAQSGQLRGQRHPYVYELVLTLQRMGWRWVETYIWSKPNAMCGRFGPRTKDSFEYVYHFSKSPKPYFDLGAVRVPYKSEPAEIERSRSDDNGRRRSASGFGRDRSGTYGRGGADPGNVISATQTSVQHTGRAGQHTAIMPEEVAEFFVKAMCPPGGVVVDPFAGSGTTVAAAQAHGRSGGGIELHEGYADAARERVLAQRAA